jgi:intracellular septation protein A
MSSKTLYLIAGLLSLVGSVVLHFAESKREHVAGRRSPLLILGSILLAASYFVPDHLRPKVIVVAAIVFIAGTLTSVRVRASAE